MNGQKEYTVSYGGGYSAAVTGSKVRNLRTEMILGSTLQLSRTRTRCPESWKLGVHARRSKVRGSKSFVYRDSCESSLVGRVRRIVRVERWQERGEMRMKATTDEGFYRKNEGLP